MAPAARDPGGQAGRPAASGPTPRPVVQALVEYSGLITLVAVAIPVLVACVVARSTTLPERFIGTPGGALAGLGVVAILGLLFLIVRSVLGEELEEARRRRRALKEAKLLTAEAGRMLRKYSYRIKPEQVSDIRTRVQTVQAAAKSRDFELLRTELGTLDEMVDRWLAFARKSTMREYGESIGVAVLIALLLRSFVVEAFKIPSGSMIPTLKVGDHIFVAKFAYGLGNPISGVKFWSYAKPSRGDVIVFKYPEEPDKDFIKRVVAVEGDTVEMRGGYVYVNNEKVPRDHVGFVHYMDISDEVSPPRAEIRAADEFQEQIGGKTFDIYLNAGMPTGGCPPAARYACGGPTKVPKDTVFVMGDNRDNSHDSRFWGFVPDSYIKGKALFIWYSGDPTRTFPTGIRLERLGHVVK
jgi:signal peptidase I